MRPGDSRPVEQAASRPFRSIHIASNDNGTSAVGAVQDALAVVEANSVLLVTFFLKNSNVGGRRFGPYAIAASDRTNLAFGTSTERAVQKFQRQVGLEADGKAGMNTLSRLDAMLAFVEMLSNFKPSPFEVAN